LLGETDDRANEESEIDGFLDTGVAPSDSVDVGEGRINILCRNMGTEYIFGADYEAS
jgi:hypothetical protein